jgi:HD superfamily phosphodiesterase
MHQWARETAARWLDVPEFRERRWRHVRAVGVKAELLAPAFGVDGPLLSASAWLHDIGYAPPIQQTGFHPIGGARER